MNKMLEDPNYKSVSGLKNLFYEGKKKAYIIIKCSHSSEQALKKYSLDEVYYMKRFKLLSVLELVLFIPYKNEIVKSNDDMPQK